MNPTGPRSHTGLLLRIAYQRWQGGGMEFEDVVRSRRMIRTYDPTVSVARRTVDELLDLAVRAPSAGHTQGWAFLVLSSADARERFWTVTTSDEEPDGWLGRLQTAPCLVVCFSDKSAYLDRYAEPDKGWTDRDEARWPVPYWHIDTGMAAMILLLGAQDRGLAACFFGVPGEHWAALRAEFEVPERLEPIGVVSLGAPAPDVRSPSLRRGRRSLDDVVAYDSFGS
jgi:nitroreductase